MSLQEYQIRVVDEQRELQSRLDKLSAFVSSPNFGMLPEAEQDRMFRQANVMAQYNAILRERIAAFK
jgi:hypothetical protein